MSDIESDEQPPDELEPEALVAEEIRRVIHHPRVEAARLHSVAEAGESGAAPFIEAAMVARFIVPLVLFMVALGLGIYFAVR